MSVREIIIPGNQDATLQYAINEWVRIAKEAISTQGKFTVALSGGSTPRAIYKGLLDYKDSLDWSKVLLFWSDERAVPQDDLESNYRSAMEFFTLLPVPKENIFPMKGTGDLEANALDYEKLISEHAPVFDLMMLGMGDDGHTASLFPRTHGLHAEGRTVIANFIPSKDVWRLSLTFECINRAKKTVVYILGASKAKIAHKILTGPYEPDLLPIQRVGTESNPARFILDEAAAKDLA